MLSRRTFVTGTAAFAAGTPFSPARADTVTLLNVSYDPTRELYTEINERFRQGL